MTAVRSPWLVTFGIVSVIHLVLLGLDVSGWDSVTKCFIAPLLGAWVLQHKGPRLLVAALISCFFGDLFLEIEALFTLGMAAFAVAHICFITIFIQRGALPQLRRTPWILAIYVIAAIALVTWAWGGLEPDIKPLIPVYAALLLGTASTSLAADLRAGIGGAMFLVSDGIIALGEADRISKDATATSLAIMVLYILSIFLLTTAVMSREQRTIAAGATTDLTTPTDCWPRLPRQN